MFRGRHAVAIEDLAPSPAAVAAAVRKPVRLETAENALAALRARRAAVVEEIRSLVPAISRRETDLAAERRIRELEKQRLEVEAQIVEMRRERAAVRDPYTHDVLEVLAPLERETASRLLSAIADLRAGKSLLDEIEVERQKAGAGARLVPDLLTGQLEEWARRVLQVAG